MITDNQYIALFLALLIVFREGFQQADWKKPNPSYSDIWHLLGWVMRFIVFGILFRAGANWIVLSVSVVMMWPIYNIAINIGRGNKWYYVSKKGIDGVIRKVLFWVNFDK